METWFIITLLLCIASLIKSILGNSKNKKLPPGPTTVPIFGSFIWLRKSFFDLEPTLHNLMLKYGPIVTLKFGSRPAIFIADHSSAHRALVQAGAIFSDRPQELSTAHVINSHNRNISTAAYGPNWRLFRRNMAETIHPVRLNAFSSGRRRVLGIFLRRLLLESKSGGIEVVDHFRHAVFSLLFLMCFGEIIEDEKLREIEVVQRKVFMSVFKYNVLNIWPKVGRIIFWRQRKELIRIREDQDSVLIPFIKTRLDKAMKQKVQEDDRVVAYVDSLVDLKLPEEGHRKLSDKEMVGLCGEFLNAGTDTTSTTWQWIMFNLVKHPQVQEKLYQEIISVVGLAEELAEKVVKEEELIRMPYLKAVVLESLRRHPPTHFVVPHSVTEEVELDGYLFPKNAVLNFMVAEMGRNGEVWKDPMEFRPERFLNENGGEEGFDITCSKEIKMMPFGAGRRICPGYTVALLHLDYFVANLVWNFEWRPAAGNNIDVDLSEKQGFTVGMKNPLLVCISPRAKP